METVTIETEEMDIEKERERERYTHTRTYKKNVREFSLLFQEVRTKDYVVSQHFKSMVVVQYGDKTGYML